MVYFINKGRFLMGKLKRKLTVKESNMIELIDIPGLAQGINKKIFNYLYFLADYFLPLEIIKSPILSIRGSLSSHFVDNEEKYCRMTKSKVTTFEIPGDHNSIFTKPYVDKLAQTILKNI
jgi:hypothetical protein